MKLLRFKNRTEVFGEPLDISWEEFVASLTPIKLIEGEQVPHYIPGEAKNNSRGLVTSRSMIVLDYNVKNAEESLFSLFKDKIMRLCKYYAHSLPLDNLMINNRYIRLIIPLSEPIEENKFTMLVDVLVSRIGIPAEGCSKDRYRLISYPIKQEGYEYFEGKGSQYFY